MKRKYLLVWLVTAGLVLAGCGGKPSNEEPAPGANAPSAGEALEAAPPVGTGCYASIPLVAGSREDAGRQEDTNATILSMGGKTAWFPGEIRVYYTSRSTDAVLEHFKAALPEAGWQESSNIPGKNWGFMRWKKEGFEAQLLTGQFDQTVYVLGCLQLAPTPTPIPVAALAMKASFDLLGKVSGLNDLAFYGYQAFGVKEDGLAVKYTISGYSASAGKFCSLQADEQVVELNCRDESAPSDPLVDDLNTLKDSPELMQEAFQTYTACPDGANLAVNLTQSEAQLLCSSNGWSGSISPYR